MTDNRLEELANHLKTSFGCLGDMNRIMIALLDELQKTNARVQELEDRLGDLE